MEDSIDERHDARQVHSGDGFSLAMDIQRRFRFPSFYHYERTRDRLRFEYFESHASRFLSRQHHLRRQQLAQLRYVGEVPCRENHCEINDCLAPLGWRES